MENKLELRLYGLVPYNISPIQQSIQYGHCAIEYALKYFNDEDFQDWANNYKTFIILNGGTTNENPEDKFYGSLQKHRDELIKNDIKIATFKEPDLNNTLTAITFLVDERVFKKKPYFPGDIYYPDFYDYLILLPTYSVGIKTYMPKLEEHYAAEYADWFNLIGGEKNLFLRKFLKDLKLA